MAVMVMSFFMMMVMMILMMMGEMVVRVWVSTATHTCIRYHQAWSTAYRHSSILIQTKFVFILFVFLFWLQLIFILHVIPILVSYLLRHSATNVFNGYKIFDVKGEFLICNWLRFDLEDAINKVKNLCCVRWKFLVLNDY